MFAVNETKTSIVFENKRAEIWLSKNDALLEKVIDKATGRDIKAGDYFFFGLTQEGRDGVIGGALTLKDDVITVSTEIGSFDVRVKILDDYFTFELITVLPEACYSAVLANGSYDIDCTDKKNTAANGVSMTYWVDPCYYPDSKSKRTCGRVVRYLKDIGAKFAYIVAPIKDMKDILKAVSLAIDPKVGLRNTTCGAWSMDHKLNTGSYIIQTEMNPEYFEKALPFYKEIGMSEVDIHQGTNTFYNGNFEFTKYKDNEDVRNRLCQPLIDNGIAPCMLTYAWYIDPHCHNLLADTEYQKQIRVLKSYTLSDDIGFDVDFINTDEGTSAVPAIRWNINSPFVLIDEEIIEFKRDPNNKGFIVVERGACGTKAAAHKKGSAVKHLDGHYGGLMPTPGSDLFYETARRLGKTYNEAGFQVIYFDAWDGIRFHCKPDEVWFYSCEYMWHILNECHDEPPFDFAWLKPHLWPVFGRMNSYDACCSSYRLVNNQHSDRNIEFQDMFLATTLGWYSFYPQDEDLPANEHVKYHHTDTIEHMGSLALLHDYSNCPNSVKPEYIIENAGYRRNLKIYKKYDDLRRCDYFSKDYLNRAKENKWELHLKEKRGGKFTLVEKDYQIKKFYDLNDPARRVGEFKNPFGAQIPFVRLEALMSTMGNNPIEIMHFDENKDLIEQPLELTYPVPINLFERLARKVKVKGNGKKGGAIAICANFNDGARGFVREYFIDTDFEGWREFILLESDNGERLDLPFDGTDSYYAVYSKCRYVTRGRTFSNCQIKTTGDMTGVRMSSIYACEHTFDVLRDPTVRIGDTEVTFNCDLMSEEFIEFDGKTAKVIDRYANEKQIFFWSTLKAPRGKFKAEVIAKSRNYVTPRAQLTIGFTGKEVK